MAFPDPDRPHAEPAEQVRVRPIPAGLRPASPVQLSIGAELRTDRLIIRPMAATDRDAYVEAVRESHAELAPWIPLHQDDEDDDALFARQLKLTRDGDRDGSACRRVATLHDGTFVGVFNVNAIARGLELQADLAVWVRTSMHGQGLAREALARVIDHCFADIPTGLGLHRVHAGIAPENAGSAALVASLGFTHEPGSRNYLKVGDRWVLHDSYVLNVGNPRPVR